MSTDFGTYTLYNWIDFLGGGPIRGMLFSQMRHKWDYHDKKAFYTFMKPSDSTYYRKGQSWTELFRMTEDQYRAALYGTRPKGGERSGGFATRVTNSLAEEWGFDSARNAIMSLLANSDNPEHLVLILRDSDNRSWYFLNERLLNKKLKELELDQVDISSPGYAFQDYDRETLSEPLEIEAAALTQYFDSPPVKAPTTEVKELTDKQRSMIKSKKMPSEYNVSASTLVKAAAEGYDKDEIRIESRKYVSYYTVGNGRNKTSLNWDEQFLVTWMDNAYNYGTAKRHGTNKGEKPSQGDVYRELARRMAEREKDE